MNTKHASLRSGGWSKLSLCEQLGNVGSEVNRALRFENKDRERFENSFFRALDLLDLTLADPRWRTRLKEIARARELLCAAVYESHSAGQSRVKVRELNNYFYRFALASRLSK